MTEDCSTIKFFSEIEKKQEIKQLPTGITFEVTPLCIFRCKMCYVRQDSERVALNGGVRDMDFWLSMAKQARDAGVLAVGLTGGEIFAYPNFMRLYESIYDMGMYPMLLSNGYLINDETVQALKKRKPYYIRITLYGASDETYKKVCNIENGFTAVTQNILKLKDAGITVLTTMTEIKDNAADAPLIYEWTKEHDIPFSCSTNIRMPVRGAESQAKNVRIEPDYSESEIELEHTGDLYAFVPGKPFSCCKNYRRSCVVTWEGNLIGCNFLNAVKVDAKQGNLTDNFRLLWDKLDELKTPSECYTCKYKGFCNPCPGALEGESGNPEMVSKYVCALGRYNYMHVNLKKEKTDESIICNSITCE